MVRKTSKKAWAFRSLGIVLLLAVSFVAVYASFFGGGGAGPKGFELNVDEDARVGHYDSAHELSRPTSSNRADHAVIRQPESDPDSAEAGRPDSTLPLSTRGMEFIDPAYAGESFSEALLAQIAAARGGDAETAYAAARSLDGCRWTVAAIGRLGFPKDAPGVSRVRIRNCENLGLSADELKSLWFEMLTRAADGGVVAAAVLQTRNIPDFMFHEPNSARANAWRQRVGRQVEAAALSGDVQAMNAMGRSYAQGFPFARDPSQAAIWLARYLERADRADLDRAPAEALLSSMCKEVRREGKNLDVCR